MTVNIRLRNTRSAFDSLRDQLYNFVTREERTRAQRLLSNLEAATPVDTGFARDSWRITTTRSASRFREARTVIYNTAEYIEQLNAGSSRQAPARFIETEALRLFEPDAQL